MQYVFNESSFVTNIPDDPGLTYGLVSAIQPDVAFGAYYKNKTMNYGIGIQQLLSSTLYKTSISFLERHYFLTAGYVIAQNRQVTLEPSILLKGMENTTISFDLNLKVIFQNKFILGASYRNHDGIILLLGINTGKLLIAYNYDLITSRLFKYNKGSHEIFLGYKICRNKSKKDSFGKRGVHCPAYNL
ncbi:MAG: hypothetical protein A2265_06305 [Bacteroidetes bacterium RIFOXYA12_FULL_33_9]|nr:MAG: hypothetical protein A2265_06305 [Bacteroidetes bacterium RIFOXYA12_FULL_33_9]